MGMSESTSSGRGESGNKQKPKRSIGQVIDTIAKWTVLIVGLPIRMTAAMVAQFVTTGGTGRAVAGGAMFLIGSAISADSVWQTVFQQRPLFGFFDTGYSWYNVPAALFNPFFYLAFLIGLSLQVVESQALRGKNPGSARRELQDHMDYDLESKPSGKIDLVGELWKDYKTAGMRDRSSGGLVVLGIWVFDLVTTFAARNPFTYTDPMMILGCILFNFGTMVAGEMGFAILKMTKD